MIFSKAVSAMMSVLRSLKPWRAAKFGLAVSLLTLAVACTPPTDTAATPDPAASAAPVPAEPQGPSTVLEEQPGFAWQALAPSTILSEAPPAKLGLSEGYAYLLYPSTPVSAGDKVDFTFTASGAAGGLRVVLMRHCGQGSDGDSASEVFEISEKPVAFTVTHTFAEAHPCLRVMFQSRDSVANTVEIWNWKLTPPAPKTPATPPASAPAAPASAPAAPAASTPPAATPARPSQQ